MNRIDIENRNKDIKKDYEELNLSTSDLAYKYNLSTRAIQLLAKENNWRRSGKTKKSTVKLKKCTKTGEYFDDDSYFFIYLVDLGDYGVYIGSTKDIPQRFRVHISDFKKGKHSSRIINKIAETDLDFLISRFNNPQILYATLNGSKKERDDKEREIQAMYIDNGYRVLGGIY